VLSEHVIIMMVTVCQSRQGWQDSSTTKPGVQAEQTES
jgi:hypothetical protein